MGFTPAPWPMFLENRRELRSLLKMQPEVIVTNQPELLRSVIEAQESGQELPDTDDLPLNTPEALAAAQLPENS